MNVSLRPVDTRTQRDALIAFLSSNRFPFHGSPAPTAAEAAARVDRGDFGPPDNIALWIDEDDIDRVGVIVFEEIAHGTPLIDLRIAERHRGRGIGVAALRAATTAIFAAHPDLNRIEGNTRSDNTAMRLVFDRAGYVKESHYREAWPVAEGTPMDSIGYAILRRDWESGTTTPVDWAG
ncbi:GNAT family N-acetyltransferase [Leifsonia aquatica]|uniref:GNAT family N-acetyltransferase n=1 Tax=Leifsonia aquatica TaxID=144185 RepID=UPI000469FAB2|nr:GNAT family protein [Leifsonia aquatica]